MNAGAEPKPDPRLVAALRHAPDADLQAPPEVTARVMAAARAAVAPARPRAFPAWPRPWALGASGALASVLMAGFVAVLWRGEPPPETVVASAPEPAPAPVAEPPAAARPPAALAEAPSAPERRLAAPPARPAAKSAAPAPVAADAARRERAAADAAPPQPTQDPRVAAAAGHTATPAAVAAPPTAPPAAAAPPVAAPPAAVPVAPATAPVAEAAAPASLPRLDANTTTAFAPLAGQRQPLAWQVDGRVPAPADMAWLRELDRVALPRWRWTEQEAEAPPGARRIRLNGIADRATLIVGDGFVQWCNDGAGAPRCRHATLDAAETKRLMDMLPPR
jgi:hypothetical protein